MTKYFYIIAVMDLECDSCMCNGEIDDMTFVLGNWLLTAGYHIDIDSL